jgi:hypothetical protein
MKTYYLIPLILFAFFAWSPWQTQEAAEKTVVNAFISKQADVMDGCGLGCDGCGVEKSERVPFGYMVTLKYQCGMKAPSSESFQEEKILVTSIGIQVPINKQ